MLGLLMRMDFLQYKFRSIHLLLPTTSCFPNMLFALMAHTYPYVFLKLYSQPAWSILIVATYYNNFSTFSRFFLM